MTDEPRTPGRARTIDAGGVALAVTEYAGDGPPLVLLHGIGSRGVSWWPVLDRLAAHFHPYVLDLRGHGGSAKPARGYLLPDYADDLAAALDALKLERPRLLGHSLGALVILQWATNHPHRAAAIALEDPPLRSVPETLAAFDGWLALASSPVEQAATYYRREHPDWSAEDVQRRAESITGTAPAVFHELRADAAANLAAQDAADRIAPLAALSSPVLLVHGDPETGSHTLPADAARFVATLPDARLARIPGVGHEIHREFPDAFLAAVVPFLTSAAC